VAHELNNELTVIIGYNDGVSRKLGREDPLQGELTEVRAAAEPATALTRDLLAFARRQMLAPEQVIASQIVDGLRRMLRPALGEEIELVITDRSHQARVFAPTWRSYSTPFSTWHSTAVTRCPTAAG